MILCLNIECFPESSASIDPLGELRYFRVVPDLKLSAAFFPFHRDPVQSWGNTRDEFRDDGLLETPNKSIHKRDPRSPSEDRALGEADRRAVPKNRNLFPLGVVSRKPGPDNARRCGVSAMRVK